MKLLLALDRIIGKAEVLILTSSLILMLLLTLYSVAYRNLASPTVLWLQGKVMEQERLATAGSANGAAGASGLPLPGTGLAGIVSAPTATAATGAPAAAGSGAAAGSAAGAAEAYLGDLADDAAPAAGSGAAAANAAGAAEAYLGDLADDAAPAAGSGAAAGSAAGAAGAYLGDLADDAAPAAGSGAAAANAAGAAEAYLGDLADDAAPAAGSGAAAGSAAGTTEAYLGDLTDDAAAAAGSGAAAELALAPQGDGAGPAEAALASPAAPMTVMAKDTLLISVLKWFNFGWLDVITRHLLLWVAFFGAAVGVRGRRYIKIDVFSRLFSARGRETLLIVLDLFAAGACVFLARASWAFLASEHAAGTMLHGALPSWVGIGVIPFGFGLLTWHFGLEAVLSLAHRLGFDSAALAARRAEQAVAQQEGHILAREEVR